MCTSAVPVRSAQEETTCWNLKGQHHCIVTTTVGCLIEVGTCQCHCISISKHLFAGACVQQVETFLCCKQRVRPHLFPSHSTIQQAGA
ncbi:hypothetical protein BRADI_3g45935v3 [Brachypodium distachyon]|uniref:Uncharacterized protein n=1 Tax=Brachypodium distachyon TaxID=15368 RepID=A0A2K2D3H9_BRADI|nr:hypothetical protein BRADI_3g45935v3 [Brachypodium distachyon]